MEAVAVDGADAPAIDLDIARAARGDTAAFERLYREHVARVYTLARRMVGEHEADEATQDVFVRVWEKLGTFRGHASFSTWLHRVAVNVFLGRLNKAGTHAKRFQYSAVELDHASTRPASDDMLVDFEMALEQLPDGAREVFVLYDVEGYKHNEIAELLGVSPGTSKSQLHRARMIMREHLTR